MNVKLFEEWIEDRKWESPEYWKRSENYWNSVLPKTGYARNVFTGIIERGRGASYKQWVVLDRARSGYNAPYSTKH
jgi:hypothetical protein